MAGFGIKTADDAKILAESSEGIVIGSSIVEMINEESNSKEFDRISIYLKEMKAAISWKGFVFLNRILKQKLSNL